MTREQVEQANIETVRNYRLAFGSPAGQAVLVHLAPFCHSNTTCFDANPLVHARNEGRRDVWLTIQNFMNLSTQQITALSRGEIIRGLMKQGDPNG